MKGKTSIIVDERGMEGFFERAHARAQAMDRGERLPSERVIAFERAEDMLRMMTTERVRLLDDLRNAGESRITDLAARLGRDKRAVGRDVNDMREHGLVRTKYITNAGHGRKLVVMPTAKRLKLKAAI